MLVEFIGCSGAGKTTLCKCVWSELQRRGISVAESSTLVAERTRTAWLTNDSGRNLLLSVILVPILAASFSRYRRFLPFAFSRIRDHRRDVWDYISRARSTVRLMEMDALLRNEKRIEVVLVDEGMLGCAHNLFAFAHRDMRLNLNDVRQFADVVPTPDLVVHVMVPWELALERTLQRPDPPLRREATRERFSRFIQQGQVTFQALTELPAMQGRVLSVENSDSGATNHSILANRIVDFIVEYQENHESP